MSETSMHRLKSKICTLLKNNISIKQIAEPCVCASSASTAVGGLCIEKHGPENRTFWYSTQPLRIGSICFFDASIHRARSPSYANRLTKILSVPEEVFDYRNFSLYYFMCVLQQELVAWLFV